MKQSTVLSLAAVLFKSYFRASRPGQRSSFSNPLVVFGLDCALFAVPFGLVFYLLQLVPVELVGLFQPVVLQALVAIPVLLTSSVIVAGILFELGQTSGLASSEAVNWLPISPSEYVVASSLSVCFAYSSFLFLVLGVTVPLALAFGLGSVVPVFILLFALAFLLGGVIIEVLRAVMNRISTSVYKKSGRFGVVFRLVLVIILLVVIQLAFNPYILYSALSGIVVGVSLAWFVPMVWPSMAIVSLLTSNAVRAGVFTALSVLFTAVIFEAAAMLRARYWSPVPVTINISTSMVYVPQARSLRWLSPIASAIVSKELKSLSRRREMARFLAIPVMLVVASLLPILTTGAELGSTLGGMSFFLVGEVATFLPLMLSSIGVGGEGKSILNVYMLPISAGELIAGKLFLAWGISGLAVLAVALLMQFLAPVVVLQFLGRLVALFFIVVVEGFLGLGVGAKYPDFTVGPRARYVTLTGFAIVLATGALATVGLFTPMILYLAGFFTVLGGGDLGAFMLAVVSTVGVGLVLIVLTRSYCRRGIEQLLANIEL